MELSEVQFGEQPPVDGYGTGYFRIGGELFEGSVLISSQGVTPWPGFEALDQLIDARGDYDVLFLGMGADIAALPAAAKAQLDATDINYEIMSSPAAARSYNVLLSEGRRIAAALLAVGK
ncbi:MAG: Mth938-like domain-containing protein [Pseudomonadota bacterium]